MWSCLCPTLWLMGKRRRSRQRASGPGRLLAKRIVAPAIFMEITGPTACPTHSSNPLRGKSCSRNVSDYALTHCRALTPRGFLSKLAVRGLERPKQTVWVATRRVSRKGFGPVSIPFRKTSDAMVQLNNRRDDLDRSLIALFGKVQFSGHGRDWFDSAF